MDKRHNKKRYHANNRSGNKRDNNRYESNNNEESSKTFGHKFRFKQENIQAQLQIQEKQNEAILELKNRNVVCPLCKEQIVDVASSICDKKSGEPVHFECVMNELVQSESVGKNEKICYIGQGRFGILYFENPRDQRKFQIKKIIEWENRDNKVAWRDEMSALYSQVY